jgi:ABC-type Fe3+ transport system, periplasmic component
MSDPSVSGTMYAIVKGIIDQKGEKAGWEYWNKVNDNITFYGKRGKDPQEKLLQANSELELFQLTKWPLMQLKKII